MVTSPHTQLLLRSLGYPQSDTFAINDHEAFRNLVFHLEDKWIRAKSVDERGPLKSKGSAWHAALQQYLDEVDCPLAFSPGRNEEEVLDWLLHLAVSYAFDDTATTGGSSEADRAASKSFPDWETPATQQAVEQLCKTLRLNVEGHTPQEQLLAARSVVETQILPAIDNGSGTSITDPMAAVEAHMATLGFSTQDARVDAAATIMRLLFIRDLRQLQNDVDDTLVSVQEFTQNPRSNAALGVVGR